MLIIASDIHLSDGTCSKPISDAAFYLFADRVREAAYHASWRAGAEYKPIKTIDILLLGDILDPIHSTLWLDKGPGNPGYVRPWSDPLDPLYAAKLREVTQHILQVNARGIDLLRGLTDGQSVLLPPAFQGRPDPAAAEKSAPVVRLHYMIGNHDWYYGLPGAPFDEIRAEIITRMGLSNDSGPFPHRPDESGLISELLPQYGVLARHGDIFDKFNYNKAAGRNTATLGDAFAMEMLNRFPEEVKARLGDAVPAPMLAGLRRLVNVRPALAAPLWISSQIEQYVKNKAAEQALKQIWDELADQLLELDFVRRQDTILPFDSVDKLQTILRISQHTSFNTLKELVIWIRDRMWEGEISFAEQALHEEAFKSHRAKYVVYGHTHHHEIVPLDSSGPIDRAANRIYINTGTWHTYYSLTIKDAKAQKFVPYQVMSYASFYKDKERGGRHYETWAGAFA